jgi:hydroxyacylglutathione hydrolase
LKSQTGCDVVGVDHSLLPTADRTVADGDTITLGGTMIHVIATPGHTKTSVCYHVIPKDADPAGILYTGDTLFVGGCGRPIECDASVLWKSLCRLAALPDETLVYCGHDYTLENYEFAVSVAPEMRVLRERLDQVQKAVEYGDATVPSTIAQEKATNIFLLADHPDVKAALGIADAAPEEVFAELRRRKNAFG